MIEVIITLIISLLWIVPLVIGLTKAFPDKMNVFIAWSISAFGVIITYISLNRKEEE